jgi:ABC-2 type transport system ATP-binding protein
MTSDLDFKGAPCLSLQGIAVAFGAQRVLEGLDWALPPGQVVGLLGRNGAGKTTLIETLLGLRDADAGKALLFGQPAAAIDDAARARIGYVPQRSDLFEWMTADQLLAYFRSFYPRWNTAKVDGLISRWDIARDKPLAKLSGGQQQRLSIIRALAHEPELLVLDEPVASLDPAGRRDFLRELVEQVVDRQTTVVFSTHILSDLERVALDVAFLSGGRIALHASLDELLESSVRLNGAEADVRRFVAEHRLSAISRGVGAPTIVRLPAEAGVPTASAAVTVDRVTLEDLFMALTA